jgi:hypothetical protein
MISRSKPYQYMLQKTLHLYEHYVLPREIIHPNGLTHFNKKKRTSLLQLKRQEFKDRKRMLNPYQK